MADSIKQFGLLQPILVQDKKNYYEIIAGERRWRAAKIAGLKEIPVIIRNYTEREIIEISLIENIQREDLNPIEEAHAFKRLLEEFHLKQDEVAECVSKSRTAVLRSLSNDDLKNWIFDYIENPNYDFTHHSTLMRLYGGVPGYGVFTPSQIMSGVLATAASNPAVGKKISDTLYYFPDTLETHSDGSSTVFAYNLETMSLE